MSKFFDLANAQAGHTTRFDFTSRQGDNFHMDIAVHAGSAMLRRNGKYIGSVDYIGKITIFGYSNTPQMRWIQLFIEECEKEDSCVAPAWKEGIIGRYIEISQNANKELNEARKALANI